MLPILLYVLVQNLSIGTGVEQILTSDPSLQAARLKYESRVKATLPATMKWLPSLEGSGSKTWFSTNDPSEDVSFRTQGDLHWNLFHFGSDYYGLKAANQENLEAKGEYLARSFELEARALDAVINYIRHQAIVEVSEKLFELRKELMKTVNARYSQGRISKQEFQSFQVDYSNAAQRLQIEKSTWIKAREELRSLLKNSLLEFDSPFQIQAEQKAKVEGLINAPLEIERQPEWAQRRAEVEKLKAQSRSEFLAFLPRLDSTGSLGMDRVNSQNKRFWSAELKITVPLFDQLTSYSASKSSDALAASKDFELKEFERKIRAQNQSSKEALKSTLLAFADAEKTLNFSEEIFKANEKRFELGRLDANDLLVHQNRLLDSQSLYLDHWSQIHREILDLAHSMGLSIVEVLH